jgi:moderate conductance mechanosensitive channel
MPDIWSAITADRYYAWFVGAIHVVIIIAGGLTLSFLVKRVLRRVRSYAIALMVRRGDALNLEMDKRATTIVKVIQRPLVLLIWVAVVLTIMAELKLPIEPTLAGAGLGIGAVGVAIGLGAQTLIRDMLGGFFVLLENQIRVNDVAVINGTSGLVEEINLRTTVLRGENGAVHIFPNGSIQSLANLTREYAFFVFEIALDFGQEPEPALNIMREVAAEMRTDPPFAAFILADLELLGMDRLSGGSFSLKGRIKTVPMKQWMIGREMNHRLRARLSKADLRMPVQTAVVRLDPAPAFSPEAMKEAVRAAMQEIAREKAV